MVSNRLLRQHRHQLQGQNLLLLYLQLHQHLHTQMAFSSAGVIFVAITHVMVVSTEGGQSTIIAAVTVTTVVCVFAMTLV